MSKGRPIAALAAPLAAAAPAAGQEAAKPGLDCWGPGTRAPTLLISPFAKCGLVDHTVMDTTAILKLIETRYGLAPLATRDAASPDMTEALDLQQ